MMLVDAGPLVALFDPADRAHKKCVEILRDTSEPFYTTLPVLTEAFYLLNPASAGAHALMDFVVEEGLSICSIDSNGLIRAFELMRTYTSVGMDFADASLVVAAELLKTRRVFTIDRRDFTVYRLRRGHRQYPFDIIG